MLNALPYLNSRQPAQPLLSYKCISLRILFWHCYTEAFNLHKQVKYFAYSVTMRVLLPNINTLHCYSLVKTLYWRFSNSCTTTAIHIRITHLYRTHTAVLSYLCCRPAYRHLVSEHSNWYTNPPLSLHANVACYHRWRWITHGSVPVTVANRTTPNEADCWFLPAGAANHTPTLAVVSRVASRLSVLWITDKLSLGINDTRHMPHNLKSWQHTPSIHNYSNNYTHFLPGNMNLIFIFLSTHVPLSSIFGKLVLNYICISNLL